MMKPIRETEQSDSSEEETTMGRKGDEQVQQLQDLLQQLIEKNPPQKPGMHKRASILVPPSVSKFETITEAESPLSP